MADISQYTNKIKNAVYGEEVRDSIIDALNKVNDDNESYQTIKEEVINAKDDVDEQVENFDAKIRSAQTAISDLQTATSTANTAKSQLQSATSTANTAKANLQNATSTANTAKTAVEEATDDANTAIAGAGIAKSNLETVISDSVTKKTALETAISNATTIKNQLDTTNKTASTAKTNLETAISNASTAKSELEAVITSAGTIKSELSSLITSANTAKTNLENATNTANSTFTTLQAENASASSNLEELRSENFNSQEILTGVTDLKAYLGLIGDDVLGVEADFANKTFKRLAGAVNLTAGANFDAFSPFGGRKRCNVADDGTITAYYGDSNYTEDGSNGQVMVYQPKFYYLTVPIIYDLQEKGVGYHLRKANYYVSANHHVGFRLHPAFYDANGNEVDYILLPAFEGSLYDTSASAYLMNDEQVMTASEDLMCSIAGVKPASGLTQQLTRPNIEQMAKNRGAGWHSYNIKAVSANQLLMIVEYATFNLQTAITNGVVSIADNSSYNCSSLTGSTSELGNASGKASQTINTKGDASTTETANGKTAVSYRGMENPWGNIWDFVYGINIWGNGQMNGGEPYICSDFNYSESKNNDNYEGAGFYVTNANGYVSAFGYSQKYDWLFLPSEALGNSSLPVGDYAYITTNLNGYRIALLGGSWHYGARAGGFCWSLANGVGGRSRDVGGRLVYVPTATV